MWRRSLACQRCACVLERWGTQVLQLYRMLMVGEQQVLQLLYHIPAVRRLVYGFPTDQDTLTPRVPARPWPDARPVGDGVRRGRVGAEIKGRAGLHGWTRFALRRRAPPPSRTRAAGEAACGIAWGECMAARAQPRRPRSGAAAPAAGCLRPGRTLVAVTRLRAAGSLRLDRPPGCGMHGMAHAGLWGYAVGCLRRSWAV